MIVTGIGVVLFKHTPNRMRIYRQAVPRRSTDYIVGAVRILSVGHPAMSHPSLYIQGDVPKYDNRNLVCTSSDLQDAFKTLLFAKKACDGVTIKYLIL